MLSFPHVHGEGKSVFLCEVQEGGKRLSVSRVKNLVENKTSCIPAGLQRPEGMCAAGLILI